MAEGRLCNFAPRDAYHRSEAAVRELEAIRDDQELLRALLSYVTSPGGPSDEACEINLRAGG